MEKPMERQQLREEQELIRYQVDNAIALFDSSNRLVLFNQQLALMWGRSVDELREQPHFNEVFSRVVADGYWSESQYRQLRKALELVDKSGIVLDVDQANGVDLEVSTTVTYNNGILFTFRDVTSERQARRDAEPMQASLNGEVKRLRFLLGLNERLQSSEDLGSIAEFALKYLVEAMAATFGDVKLINGEGKNRQAAPLSNCVYDKFIATEGEAVSQMQEALDRRISEGEGLLWQVVSTGEPLFVENYDRHPQAVAAFRHPDIDKLALFPIPATDGKIIAVLTLEGSNLQKLRPNPHEEMLLAACRTLGVAIERAQAQGDLRRMNEDLKRASQLKSEFLASMSHELRTPLNSILGFSDLLLRRKSESLTERQVNYLGAIGSCGKHLLALINDILDLSKIEAGKTELDLHMLSVQALCKDCMRMMQPRADQKRLALSLQLDYSLDAVPLDERRICQILINLLSNAVTFTPVGGTVKLSAGLAYGSAIEGDYRPDRSQLNPSTPYLCLEVQDSGIGIAESKWHLLFRPFQQVDSGLNRHHEGTGLGLVLTMRLAQLHGGTVSFQSTEGVGSTFRVWLPLTEMRQEFKSIESPPDGQNDPKKELDVGEKGRVLVVDDQPINQALISDVMELEGYAIELLCDGKSMMEVIHSPLVTPQTLPDLILMDVQLSDIDGFELLSELKAHPVWQQVPVVAITAMAMVGDRDRCLAAGADAYLSKPLNFDKVLATTQFLLLSRKNLEENRYHE